jgi:hypothetical protein
LGHGGTRVSLFVSLDALRTARVSGWHEYKNSTGERIITLAPEMFPVLAEMIAEGCIPPEQDTRKLLAAAEASPLDPSSVERARRGVSVLVRDARFRHAVVEAYVGRCAMCGLGLGIVEAAHIVPASVVGSTDAIENGVALCPNHHAAYDRHLILVDPSTFRIVVSPAVHGSTAPADRAFVSSTFAVLHVPSDPAARPSVEMLVYRSNHFEDAYRATGCI